MPGLRLHSHERAVHELHHVAYGVEGAHLLFYRSLFIVEQFYLVWLVEVVGHRVGLVGETLYKHLVCRLPFGNVFDEVWYNLMIFVTPRVLPCPVAVKVALHLAHLLACRFFSVLLHARVNGGVYLQSAAVQVVAIFLAPVLEIVGYGFAEVFCLTVIIAFYAVVELYGYGAY